MNLGDVMDELGTAVGTIVVDDDGNLLRQFPYWAPAVKPPCVVVGWPDIDYHGAMARGMNILTDVPVIVLVGAVDAKASRDTMVEFLEGTGARSVQQTLEAHEGQAYDVATVTRAEVGTMRVAGTELLAATFFVDIVGQG